MPWVPIADSGVAFTFGTDSGFTGTVTMPASVVTGVGAGGAGGTWTIAGIASPVAMRITAQSYSSDDPLPATFRWSSDGLDFTTVANESGGPNAWAPSPLEMGPAIELTFEFGYSETTGSFQFLVEVWEDDPSPTTCEELGRVTRAYVSGYQRSRVHRSNLVRGEKRCLVANFNGAIPPARSIASVTWRVIQNQSVFMSDARIDGREVTVLIAAQIGDGAAIKCEVTLDNGEVYNQLFEVCIRTSPWFQGEISPPSGPYELTATA